MFTPALLDESVLRAESRFEGAEFFWGGFGCGGLSVAPLGDAGLDISALSGRNSVAPAFLRGIAISQNLLKVGR